MIGVSYVVKSLVGFAPELEPEPDEDDEFTDAAFYHNYTTAAEKQPEDKTFGYGNGNGGGVFDC